MAEAQARIEPLSEATIAAIQSRLDAFAAGIAGIRNAVVASVDGFALARTGDGDGRDDRLAAMTSSMLGLAKAVGRELFIGELEVLILEAVDGKVLMLSIPVPSRPLLLMAACTQRSVTGQVLWHARQCSQDILERTTSP